MNTEVEHAGIAARRCAARSDSSVCPLAPTRTSSSTPRSSAQASLAGDALQEQIRRWVCWRVQEPRQQRCGASARLLTPIVGNPAADQTRGAAPHAHRREVSCGKSAADRPASSRPSSGADRRASSRPSSRSQLRGLDAPPHAERREDAGLRRVKFADTLYGTPKRRVSPARCGPGPRRTGSYPKSSVHSMRQRQRRCRPCREVSCGPDAWHSSLRAPSSAGHPLGVPSRCLCCVHHSSSK